MPSHQENEWITRVAEEYGFSVEFADLKDFAGGYLSVSAAGRKIVINKRDKPYRRNFSGALEIARYRLGQHKKDRNEYTLEENNEAYSLAADIMLDAAQIKGCRGMSLQDMQKMFPWCSHEVIARKLLHIREAVLTIWDRWQLTVRLGSQDYRFPKAPQEFEVDCAKECRRLKENITRTGAVSQNAGGSSIPPDYNRTSPQPIECECYYIEEPGNPVDRVIMFTSTQQL